jgi:hypothetical protein
VESCVSYVISLVVVPLIVQASLVVALRMTNAASEGYDFGLMTPVLSSATGFSLLTRRLNWPQMFVVGLLYLPAIYVVLMYFFLVFVGLAYGDYL